jgi:branched-chain amino acid aminotransferase
MHRFVLHNDDVRESSERLLSPGQVGLLSGWGVFSTIRIADGVPFAFEHHWDRMRRDARLLHVPFPSDPEYIRTRLLSLIEANGASNATLRVAIVRNRGGIWEGPNERDFDIIAFTTALKKWGSGVRLTVQGNARYSESPFSGAKMLSWAMNLVWLEEAQARGFDEVILLNERGEVSECTSANIFAAYGNEVWTPPLNSGCLPGVTREILCHEIHADGFPVRERALSLEDLERADEVFITSTTRNLLPVIEIDGRQLRHHAAARAALDKAFGDYTDAYILRHGTSGVPRSGQA